jgi:hypothetical protein
MTQEFLQQTGNKGIWRNVWSFRKKFRVTVEFIFLGATCAIASKVKSN